MSEAGSLAVADRLPLPGSVSLQGGASSAPAPIEIEDYSGDASDRTGIGALEAITGVNMLCVPDLMALYQQGRLDLEGVQTVQRAMIDHCENMGDRIAILDAPPGFNAQQIQEWRVEKTGFDSAYATMYWPWIKVFDPGTNRNVYMPPSGAMAGIWGRTDDSRGVHKAPANEVVRGALDIELNITRGEHDLLNPVGINVIRSFPGRGIRVWGARTLASEPAWRYLNVRRLFNYLESSILAGTQWMVFEPNDRDLWDRASRTIRSFLYRVWRTGALFGQTPDQAYYVKCDAETNPPAVIEAGQVVIEIGVAPVKPAEFVVFRLAQLSAGGEQ
jgi:phage tail sheath protein FI